MREGGREREVTCTNVAHGREVCECSLSSLRLPGRVNSKEHMWKTSTRCSPEAPLTTHPFTLQLPAPDVLGIKLGLSKRLSRSCPPAFTFPCVCCKALGQQVYFTAPEEERGRPGTPMTGRGSSAHSAVAPWQTAVTHCSPEVCWQTAVTRCSPEVGRLRDGQGQAGSWKPLATQSLINHFSH